MAAFKCITHAYFGQLLLLVLFCGLAAGARNFCSYGASCSDEGVTETTLRAICAAGNGVAVSTSINLNDRIGNINGRLVCPGSNFAASCSNVGLNGESTLFANCRTISGRIIQTRLNLNDCISTIDGIFRWCV